MTAKKKPGSKTKTPAVIPSGLARALKERKRNSDSETLLNDLIEVWGGTRRFAQDVYSEFQGAARGGMTRQRILEMMQRLVVTNTTHEIGKAIRPSDLSDEELEAVAMKYLGRLNGDGTVTEEAAVRPEPTAAEPDPDWPEEGWEGA